MSSEGKKARGEAGQRNAEYKPFRLNGWSPDWAARAAGAFQVPGAPSSGSMTARGILGGAIVANLGYGALSFNDAKAGHAFDRCTHPMLRD